MKVEDTELLTVCWTKAQPTVAAFISSLVPDFHQAEDVLHQVALALVRKFAEYDRSQPFTAWALGVARFEVLRHRRQYATDRHEFSEALIDRVAAEYERLADDLDDRRVALRECLEQVQGRSLEALRLRYLEGLRTQRIAEQMHVADGAVRTLLHRTREVLRDCIERRLGRRTVRP